MLLRKILISLFVLILLFATLNLWILNRVISKSFKYLETIDVNDSVERIKASVDEEIDNMEVWSSSWLIKEDFHGLLNKPQEIAPYFLDRIYLKPFVDNDLTILKIIDSDFKEIIDYNYNNKEASFIKEDILLFNKTDKKYINIISKMKNGIKCGFVNNGDGLILLSIVKIYDKSNKEEVKGYLILGKKLTESIWNRLIGETNVGFNFHLSKELEEKNSDLFYDLLNKTFLILEDNESKISLKAFTLFKDINEKPLFVIEIEHPRNIIMQGKRTIILSWILSMILGIIILFSLTIIMQFLIIAPIHELNKYVKHVITHEKIPEIKLRKRKNEIGSLSHDFELLIDQLFRTRDKLIEFSYHSGMAEMASNNLHRIRNSLVPTITKIDTIFQKLILFKFDKRKTLLKEIENYDTGDEFINNVIDYFKLSSLHDMDLLESIKLESKHIERQIREIESILTDQFEITKLKTYAEETTLTQIIHKLEKSLKEAKTTIKYEVEKTPVYKGVIVFNSLLFNLIIRNLTIFLQNHCGLKHDSIVRFAFEIDNDNSSNVNLLARINIADLNCSLPAFSELFFNSNKSENYLAHWCVNSILALNGEIEIVPLGEVYQILINVPVNLIND